MAIASCKLHIADLKLGAPHFTLRTSHASRGFTYIALLAAIVILGISLGAAGKYWQSVMMREKEKELIFRGEQYRLAIERYVLSVPGRPQYPPSLDELTKDSRSAAGKRHLRQLYKDPITNEDFEVIKDPATGNRIIGVHSTSDREPIKTTGFEEQNKEFEGKKKYSEWKFIYTLQRVPAGGLVRPGGPVRPVRPGGPLR